MYQNRRNEFNTAATLNQIKDFYGCYIASDDKEIE